MNSKKPLIIYVVIMLSIVIDGCKKNTFDQQNYPEIHAYGHTWKHYIVRRFEKSHPLFSGHGILVPQEMEYDSEYIENSTEKINIDGSIYSRHINGVIQQIPNTNDVQKYTHSSVYGYNDKIYIKTSAQARLLFPDCNIMYIEGKPEIVINPLETYEFIAEFNPSTKRFLIDGVLPFPISNNSTYKELLAGNTSIDIAVVVEKSEKYACS